MTESNTASKSSKTAHWIALSLLFLMIAQPTFDNIRALLTGTMAMGEISIDVTFSKMALHLVAMVVGWVGFFWFYQRKKKGAYVSIAAHLLGFTAVLTQTPEMLDVMPTAMLVVFFVLLFIVALGPILAFKDQYS